ncbi:hypothetical protein GYMLUDRAFT_40869 [Collybiopsis luxurians FD-317 M1]|uniref:PHD-type domain-containing protein n=1 Tax=Collybiopsis luxurians FD-317 M1 TaxID=944289 RepID=A0A0D0CVQ0_9AGAR|nr:hypothetical protein GYMLUDRAFT_40869 [Collybiopsis luxurians FD-317 M1]
MEELDQQTHGTSPFFSHFRLAPTPTGYLDDIIPTLRKYVTHRRNLENGALLSNNIAEISVPSTPAASTSTSVPKTPLRSLHHSVTTPRTSTPIPLSLPAERIKAPETGKELLSHIAWLAEELMSAAQEKVNLAQAAHDYISRQIQVLAQSIKEQEASIALGTRPGTQLAPILLPDVAPPSRWTKNVTGTLVLDDDEPLGKVEETPTTLGIVVDETEQPQHSKRRGRKGRRPTMRLFEDSATGQTQTHSLKITLPAMDNRLYCYCRKPSAGEMVACDNEECVNQWFHLSCIGLATLPQEDETWYCEDCDPSKVLSKKRGRRR